MDISVATCDSREGKSTIYHATHASLFGRGLTFDSSHAFGMLLMKRAKGTVVHLVQPEGMKHPQKALLVSYILCS